MLSFSLEFLSGFAVMTDVASRDKAEWPPHPARLFMALVAAHYEFKPLPEDGPEAERMWNLEWKALQWLERQGAPEMSWPDATLRSVPKVFVPVNDVNITQKPDRVKERDLRTELGILPDRRSRQERTFPSLRIVSEPPSNVVVYRWQVSPEPETVASLAALAAKVGRLGHSTSLVHLWLWPSEALPSPHFVPRADPGFGRGVRLRVPSTGLLKHLDESFNAADIDDFFTLSDAIIGSVGRDKEPATKAFAERFGFAWSRSVAPPLRRRPSVGLWAAYFPRPTQKPPLASSPFDPDLLILAKQEGRILGLEATSALTAAFRGVLLQGSAQKPEWLTGHSASGMPSTGGHIALFPLSFVGSRHLTGPEQYADGHVLGLAIAFPRRIPMEERAAELRNVLFGPSGEDIPVHLRLGALGEWSLVREERSSPPLGLVASTWTGPSTVWASVTPIVLDRHPKHSQRTERELWQAEVSEIIARSCEQQGLPVPYSVDIDKTSWHRGAPRSQPGPDGMPWLATKEGRGHRQQVHVLIQFNCEVEGPLLLGAGRYRGYGLCKPLGA